MPALLKRWRARRSLATLPGADPAAGDGPVTQTVMAEQLGISEHHYRRLESGRRPMSSDVIAEIARVLTLTQVVAVHLTGPDNPDIHCHGGHATRP